MNQGRYCKEKLDASHSKGSNDVTLSVNTECMKMNIWDGNLLTSEATFKNFSVFSFLT